jgi:hypothetical protein
MASINQALVEAKRLKDLIKSATALTLNTPIPMRSENKIQNNPSNLLC